MSGGEGKRYRERAWSANCGSWHDLSICMPSVNTRQCTPDWKDKTKLPWFFSCTLRLFYCFQQSAATCTKIQKNTNLFEVGLRVTETRAASLLRRTRCRQLLTPYLLENFDTDLTRKERIFKARTCVTLLATLPCGKFRIQNSNVTCKNFI